PHSRLTVSVRCYPAHRDLHSFPTRRSSDLLMRITARSWSWLALAYLTVLLLVSLADQQHALSFMGSASLQTLVAILVGMFISLLLQSWMGRRLHLPERWNQAFPLLERRLNSYVPATLQAIRIAVFIIVLLVVL